jgi:DNA-binding HxlR family transcriptional regulator
VTRVTRRSTCPISSALDVLGDKWTLLVMRDLLLVGKRHYREFLESEERIATNILADRLARLEAYGIVDKTTDDPRSGKQTYHPTDKGRDLIAVLLELMSWSDRHDAGAHAPRRLVDAYQADREGVAAGVLEAGSVATYLASGPAIRPTHRQFSNEPQGQPADRRPREVSTNPLEPNSSRTSARSR